MELEGEDKSQISRLNLNGFSTLSKVAGESAAKTWAGDSDQPSVPSRVVTLLCNKEGELDNIF